MHHLTYDLGRRQGMRAYEPGRDSSNVIVRCSCGWAHSNTLPVCQERGAMHQHAFRREVLSWNQPGRATNMPHKD